jgi:adenylate cyclase
VPDDAGLEAALQQFADLIMHGQQRLSATELAGQAGVDLEFAQRLRRAMGLPNAAEGERVFYSDDLDILRRATALVREVHLDESEILYLARSLGLAASRMADSVVGFLADRYAHGSVDTGETADLFNRDRVEDLETSIVYIVRRHLVDAITRRLGVSVGVASADAVAVGFADLVGFTSLSEQLSDEETAELIERFEELATDRVVGGGGRVIKMIGDEVMFSADPADVAEIALSLAESFGPPDLPSVRVGVAAGQVVAYYGDLFGPVVNLASRATMAARPGTVLVSPALADLLREDERYEVGAIRPRRLKGIGFVQLHVLQRAAAGEAGALTRRRRRVTKRAG